MKLKQPCRHCGTPTHTPDCQECRQTKGAGTKTGSPTHQENTRRRQAVANWIWTNGHWCPGWQKPGHPTTDLTADHINPQQNHGPHGPLTILCRSCNAARRHTDN